MRPTSEKRKDMTTGDVMGYYSTVRVTEGELKADVATALSIERENPSFLTIGLNGPSAFEAAVPALKALGTETVIVALDSDARENRSVAAALSRTVDGLRESGFAVELETWTGGKDGAKGIDDAILANVEITRHSDDTDDDQVDVEVKNIEKAAKLAQPTPEEKRETADLKALKEAVESEDRGEWKERPAQTALRRIVKSDAALERARAIIEDSPVSSREFERNVKELRGENGNEHVSMEFTATMPMDVRDAERQVDFLEKSATLLINESHQAYLHDSGADVLPIRKDHLPYQAYIFKKLLITEETKEYKQIYPILRLRAYQKEPTELVRWAKYDEARASSTSSSRPGRCCRLRPRRSRSFPSVPTVCTWFPLSPSPHGNTTPSTGERIICMPCASGTVSPPTVERCTHRTHRTSSGSGCWGTRCPSCLTKSPC